MQSRSLFGSSAAALSLLLAAGSHAAVPAELHGAPAPAQAPAISEEEARQIALEGYVFFYPLISMEVTRRVTTNLPPGVKPGLGPPNAFHHMRQFPSAEFREVVRPNFDTLYSSAWLDLTREPMIITAKDTGGRYYLLPMLDMWSNVFASPGKRTSGTGPGAWAIVPPGWAGSLPPDVDRIDAPTPHVWVIGRTQTNGPADYAAVHAVQDGFGIVPLSRWGRAVEPAPFRPDPTVDMKTPPLVQVNSMSGADFFRLAAELMRTNPPQLTDWSILARLERIGIRPGESFDPDKLPPGVRAAIDRAPKDGLKLIKDKMPTLARVVNGWQMNTETMGVYGNNYLKRAIVAMVGLGANQPEDAVYPVCVTDAEGQPLLGERAYVLRFEKSQLPPAGAFWSITMYDADGFQIANPINRFAIGDRDALKYNPDGSLEIYIQHQSPGPEKESNWLPSPPSGRLGVTMRLYAPEPEALDGRWNPPPMRWSK